MIYFSKNSSVSFPIGTGVEITDGVIEEHQTGVCVGFVQRVSPLDAGGFSIQIYVAGGGGSPMILGADWDGELTRFDVVEGRVVPVATGGQGWLIPEYPAAAKLQNETVTGALYK